MGNSHDEIWRAANDDPEAFWADAASGIDWNSPWESVVSGNEEDGYRWFSGASLNTCYNAVDRHVENGRAEQRALVYDSPATGSQRAYSYSELRDEVARTAGMLASLGVVAGDHEASWVREVGGQKLSGYMDWLRAAFLATTTSLPAISVPVGLGAGGMPVGLQLIGQPRGEATLLQVARFVEMAVGGPLGPIDPVIRS